MKISAKLSEQLEIERLIALISDRCRSLLGVFVAQRLEPIESREALLERQELIKSLLHIDRVDPLPWAKVEPIEPLIQSARHSAYFNEAELLEIRHLLELARDLKAKLDKHSVEHSALVSFLQNFKDFSAEIESLQVVDDDGLFTSSASPKLALLRENLERQRREARHRLTNLLNGPLGQKVVDKQPYWRHGKFLVMLKAGAASQLPGRVIERMGTTVYFEPESLHNINHSMQVLQTAVDEEVHRLCVALSAPLLKRQKSLLLIEQTLGEVDFFTSLAAFINRGWDFPKVVQSSVFNFHHLAHPLLGEQAVPIDVQLGQGFSQLIVTGPNTGGKTVALKTVALGIWLTWVGLPVPCHESSMVGTFDQIFADIGDEQSLEQNLSTFSGHIVNVAQILEKATPQSLVLLDELGAGTDPHEGAALGVGLLEELAYRGVLTMATTHHNAIKNYATMTEGVETASVDFDEKSLKPTYKLLIGIPGSSNALHIAKRYGMPQSVIDRAWKVIQGQEADAEALMSSLHRRASMLDKQSRRLEEREKVLDELQNKLKGKQRALEEKKDSLLMKAERKAQSLVLEAEEQAKALLRDLQGVSLSEGHRRLKGHKEKNDALMQRARVTDNVLTARAAQRQNERPVGVGDWVRGSGVVGEVIEIKGKRATLQAGGLKVEVPLAKLVLEKRPKDKSSGVQVTYHSASDVGSSLMVRGSTVDEALPMVMTYLDRAFHAGYDEVSLIHGRGEGILRKAIHAKLAKTPYVARYRLGEMGEGGYGVTIVTFK